jgi:hypothetical protein
MKGLVAATTLTILLIAPMAISAEKPAATSSAGLSAVLSNEALAKSAASAKADANDDAALRAKYPVTVTVDVSDAPDMKDWAEKAAKIVEQWYPRMCDYLASDGFTPPKKITLIFKKSSEGIAATSGTTITASDGWFKAHPNDFGAIVHESIHVIQSYRSRNNPSWLVEGIDDYCRFWIYEPSPPKGRLDPSKIKYTDSYQVTGAFLAWAVSTYDKDLVKKLNAACRQGKYKDTLLKDLTGKDLDTLFEEFKKSLAKK